MFRSQMFMIGDLVKPNFISSQVYGIGIVVGVDDTSMNPKVSVMWPNKEIIMHEFFQDIIRVETNE
jgi:hypothetical protein